MNAEQAFVNSFFFYFIIIYGPIQKYKSFLMNVFIVQASKV